MTSIKSIEAGDLVALYMKDSFGRPTKQTRNYIAAGPGVGG